MEKVERLKNYDFGDLDKEYFVYIVECEDGTLYTGMSNNLLERITDHKVGNGSRYTKDHKFRRLVYFERCPGEKQARQRELEIKDKGVKYKHILIRNFKRFVSLLE